MKDEYLLLNRMHRISIGSLLSYLRKRLGLSLEELASITDFTISQLERMESGEFGSRLDTLNRYLSISDCRLIVLPNSLFHE